MEQDNPILKLFSFLSGILDKPPLLKEEKPKQLNTPPLPPKENKATYFIANHEKLSQKIKNSNKTI